MAEVYPSDNAVLNIQFDNEADEEEEMKYHIETESSRVASFEHEDDRDRCLEMMREYYDDCEFTDFNEE